MSTLGNLIKSILADEVRFISLHVKYPRPIPCHPSRLEHGQVLVYQRVVSAGLVPHHTCAGLSGLRVQSMHG